MNKSHFYLDIYNLWRGMRGKRGIKQENHPYQPQVESIQL